MFTGTLPSKTEVEKDLFGASWLAGDKLMDDLLGALFSDVWAVFDFLMSAIETESCRSCAHCWSVGPAEGDARLHRVILLYLGRRNLITKHTLVESH